MNADIDRETQREEEDIELENQFKMILYLMGQEIITMLHDKEYLDRLRQAEEEHNMYATMLVTFIELFTEGYHKLYSLKMPRKKKKKLIANEEEDSNTDLAVQLQELFNKLKNSNT